MDVDNGLVALARSRSHAAENDFLSPRDFEQRQVLESGADEDQVVVLCVVEGKQAATLYANLPVQQSENAVQFMDRQDLAHTGVMVQNKAALVLYGIVIAHARFGPAHKRRVAENY